MASAGLLLLDDFPKGRLQPELLHHPHPTVVHVHGQVVPRRGVVRRQRQRLSVIRLDALKVHLVGGGRVQRGVGVGHVLVEGGPLRRQVGPRLQRLDSHGVLVDEGQHVGFVPRLEGVHRSHRVVVAVVAQIPEGPPRLRQPICRTALGRLEVERRGQALHGLLPVGAVVGLLVPLLQQKARHEPSLGVAAVLAQMDFHRLQAPCKFSSFAEQDGALDVAVQVRAGLGQAPRRHHPKAQGHPLQRVTAHDVIRLPTNTPRRSASCWLSS